MDSQKVSLTKGTCYCPLIQISNVGIVKAVSECCDLFFSEHWFDGQRQKGIHRRGMYTGVGFLNSYYIQFIYQVFSPLSSR